MNQPAELSLEQQFSLRSFASQVEQMDEEQTKTNLVNLYRQMLVRETMYQTMLRKQWGIEPPPT